MEESTDLHCPCEGPGPMESSVRIILFIKPCSLCKAIIASTVVSLYRVPKNVTSVLRQRSLQAPSSGLRLICS